LGKVPFFASFFGQAKNEEALQEEICFGLKTIIGKN
jgi:hypothetical protein